MSVKPILAFSLAVSLTTPTLAQTEQWSQPTRTEQWSQPQHPPQPKAPQQPTTPTPPTNQAERPGIWSTPGQTRQVDPKAMDNPEVVRPQGKAPARMTGRWKLWVPGGIWYSGDGSRVYRNYTPGADMNSLTIRANGTYSWGRKSGPLVEIRPWFTQPGDRYFAVQLDATLKYMARYDAAKDKVDLFFWGVGGHAATGTRG